MNIQLSLNVLKQAARHMAANCYTLYDIIATVPDSDSARVFIANLNSFRPAVELLNYPSYNFS